MEVNKFQSFTELEVWKKARNLKNEIKELTLGFPVEEKFKLIDQIIRSSRSVNTNIAEAHRRFSYKDQINFCVIAGGSLSETLNHLIDAFDCNYISAENLKYFKEKIDQNERLLNGYISFLRSKLK